MTDNKTQDMGDFDLIICGTSVKECFLSGILASCEGKKILNIDRNDHYGGEGASCNLDQVYKRFKGPEAKLDEKKFGRSGRWSVDLAPKFLLGDGLLVQCLAKLIPSEYMQYGTVGGSYVLSYGNSGGMFSKKITPNLHVVPTTAKTALNSPLLNMRQKIAFPSLLKFIMQYDPADAKTYKGNDLKTMTMDALYTKYSINALGKMFIGHAVALQSSDAYLREPALATVMKIQVYAQSLQRFEKSPYLYPNYGLGNIADSFSRLGAIYGCTFITSCGNMELKYATDGKFTGVEFDHTIEDPPIHYTARAPIILGHPSYFSDDKSTVVGQICRSIVIVQNPVQVGAKKKSTAEDCQIIIPGSEAKRTSDIYISFLSAAHQVCPKGKYFAIVSTMNDGATVSDLADKKGVSDAVSREAKLAYEVLSANNTILEKFCWITNERAPVANLPEGVFMTRSMDAATHFQDVMKEVFDLYQSLTGKEFNVETVRDHKTMMKEAEAKQAAAMAAQTS